MCSAFPERCGKTWELAPYVLASLFVHLAFLYGISLSASKRTFAPQRPLTVYFTPPTIPEYSGISNEDRNVKTNNLPRLHESFKTQAEASIAHDNAPIASDISSANDIQPLLDSSKEIAQNEARKTEQQLATQEKIRRNSPIGLMEQDLKQPQKEIRLANGMLKIITRWGEVCFQPAPYFARDSAGVFGMPITCP